MQTHKPLGLLSAICLAACSVAAKPLNVNDADNGKQLELKVGQSLAINLATNPTTGYRWTLAGGGSPVLTQQGEPTYTPDPAANGRVGAGGMERWTFQAAKPGKQTLRLEYRRPWENHSPPANQVEFPVSVK